LQVLHLNDLHRSNFSRDFATKRPGLSTKRKCGNAVAALQKHSFPKRIIIEKAEVVKKKLTGKDPGGPASQSGRRGATGPSSLYGNALCAMWRCDDLPSRRRLLVRGIAARSDTRQRGGMPLPHLPARED
jgi:hypothetical protein